MNALVVISEILLAIGMGMLMQAISIKKSIFGKAGRRPMVGYVVLLMTVAPFFPGLPGVLEKNYLHAVLMQYAIVGGAIIAAALISVTSLVVGASISGRPSISDS